MSSATRIENMQLKDKLHKLLLFIEREGYRKCDIPACNCGSWHKVEKDIRLGNEFTGENEL